MLTMKVALFPPPPLWRTFVEMSGQGATGLQSLGHLWTPEPTIVMMTGENEGTWGTPAQSWHASVLNCVSLFLRLLSLRVRDCSFQWPRTQAQASLLSGQRQDPRSPLLSLVEQAAGCVQALCLLPRDGGPPACRFQSDVTGPTPTGQSVRTLPSAQCAHRQFGSEMAGDEVAATFSTLGAIAERRVGGGRRSGTRSRVSPGPLLGL